MPIGKVAMLALMLDASRLSGLPPVEVPQIAYGTRGGAAASFEGDAGPGVIRIGAGSIPDHALVHEFVHAIQWQHGSAADWIDCARKERLAYEVQARWLAERGFSFTASTGWRTISEAVRKSCDWL